MQGDHGRETATQRLATTLDSWRCALPAGCRGRRYGSSSYKESGLQLLGNATLQVAGEDLRSTQKYQWQDWELREHLFPKLTAEELVERITDGARKLDLNDPTNKDRARYKEEILRLESTYQSRLDSLSTEQAKVVGWGALGWAGPLAILYGFGLAVAWVVRGFRQCG